MKPDTKEIPIRVQTLLSQEDFEIIEKIKALNGGIVKNRTDALRFALKYWNDLQDPKLVQRAMKGK